NRLRSDTAALLIAVIFGIAQFAGLNVLGDTPKDAIKAISGLSQNVIITLISLFIITRSLDKTGITRWLARRILSVGGKSESGLIVLFATATALLSLLMNNLAAGALLLPSAMDVARRTGIKPSKLLIPVAYGSLLGGAATYFTTANIIVSDLLTSANPPQSPLHILDFTPTGGLIAIAGIAYLGLFGRRLLPDREPQAEQVVARSTGSELEQTYQLRERLWEVRIKPESPLVGERLGDTDLGGRLGVSVAAIWHGRQAIFAPEPMQMIRANDILLVIGREERVSQLAQRGASIGRDTTDKPISVRGVTLVEMALAPHSAAVGHTLKALEFRTRYGYTVVALLRDGRSYRTDVADISLQPGDSLLLVGSPDRIQRLQHDRDFIVFEADGSDRPVNWRRAWLAIAVTLGAVIASVLGVPTYLAMLAGAVLILLAGVVAPEEAYRSVEWGAIFLIAGMYSVSLAMVNTGLAKVIGDGMVGLVTPLGPLGLAAGAYLLTAALTQFMGGQVTALVTAPVAISAAISLHTSPQAIAVCVAIACSSSFLTPVAHPVNILMMGPGNYQFRDFFRVGWPLTILSFVMLMIGMVLFWKL
ncbi:MAG TPA: SLC13 family permease, partial [Aggregatilineales bacterium]|nr:SLC13 family permease [Aggregatilineales bacterium]